MSEGKLRGARYLFAYVLPIRSRSTWSAAASQPNLIADGHNDRSLRCPTCPIALNISRASWRNQPTLRNFSKLRSSTPGYVPVFSGYRSIQTRGGVEPSQGILFGTMGQRGVAPGGSFFHTLVQTGHFWARRYSVINLFALIRTSPSF